MNQFGIGITIASTMTYVALKFGYCSFSKITATCRYAEYPDTRYLVPVQPSCFMCIFLCIITHIPAFLRLIRVDFSTKKGVQNQPSMQPGWFFLCCTILYFLVIKYGKIPSRYFTIRSRTILEAYRKIQPGLIFTSNTNVPENKSTLSATFYGHTYSRSCVLHW